MAIATCLKNVDKVTVDLVDFKINDNIIFKYEYGMRM